MLNFFFFYISFYISLYISLDRSLCRSQIKWRTISSSFLTWLRIRCKTFFSFKTFFLNFFFFFTHSWCWHRRCGRRGLYASPLRRFWWPRLTCCPPSHVRCGSSTPGCHGLHCTRLCRPIKSHGGRTITFSHDRYSFSFFYFFFFFLHALSVLQTFWKKYKNSHENIFSAAHTPSSLLFFYLFFFFFSCCTRQVPATVMTAMVVVVVVMRVQSKLPPRRRKSSPKQVKIYVRKKFLASFGRYYFSFWSTF